MIVMMIKKSFSTLSVSTSTDDNDSIYIFWIKIVQFRIALRWFCISHHYMMYDVRAGSLGGRSSFQSQGRLPQPAHRWLTSRTSGRATDPLRLLIHLWSSSLNSDPGLNEGENTQDTLGRQPLWEDTRRRRSPIRNTSSTADILEGGKYLAASIQLRLILALARRNVLRLNIVNVYLPSINLINLWWLTLNINCWIPLVFSAFWKFESINWYNPCQKKI